MIIIIYNTIMMNGRQINNNHIYYYAASHYLYAHLFCQSTYPKSSLVLSTLFSNKPTVYMPICPSL